MPSRNRTTHCVTLAFLAIVAACQSIPASVANRAPVPVQIDSVEGTVHLVGVDAFPEITLSLGDGAPSLALDGAPSMRRVAGLRVAVIGKRAGTRMSVNRFIVIGASGIAAIDGTLSADANEIVLITADGKHHPLVNPPLAFRTNIGHRVWVSGPLEREPVAFGIIE